MPGVMLLCATAPGSVDEFHGAEVLSAEMSLLALVEADLAEIAIELLGHIARDHLWRHIVVMEAPAHRLGERSLQRRRGGDAGGVEN